MATEIDLVLGADTTQVDKGATSLDQLTGAAKKTASELAALAKVEEQMWEAGTRLVLKLEDLVATFGLTTTQVYAFRAAQYGVTEQVAPLIAQLDAMSAATKKYGVVITDVSQIEAARIAWEQSALTSFNAFKIRSLAENQAAEESAATAFQAFKTRTLAENAAAEAESLAKQESAQVAFQAFKIRTMAENRAAAIKDIDEMVAVQEAALAKQEQAITAFNAFKIRTMAENRKEAIALLDLQEKEAVALAEKQAIEEIKWNELSVKTRIAQLEKLKLYQANSAIQPATTEKTFGSAAINDLPNLTRYQNEYQAALQATATAHAAVKNAAGGAGKAVGEVGVQTARATTEAVVLAREFGRGNYTRMAGSFSILAQALGLSINPMTLLAIAAAGVGYEMVKGALEVEKMNAALIITGNYAGTTSSGLLTLAHNATAAGGSISSAKEAVLTLASSGKFTSEEIGKISQSAVLMERATGQSVSKTISQFESLAVEMQGSSVKSTEAVSKAALKLDDTYHFLTEAIFEEIRALEKDGEAKKASELALNKLAEVTDERAKQIIAQAGAIARGWHAVTEAIGSAINKMNEWGSNDPGIRIRQLKEDIATRESRSSYAPDINGVNARQIIKDKQLLAAAEGELATAQGKAEAQSKRTRDESNAMHDADKISDYDNKHKKDSLDGYTNAVKAYKLELEGIRKVNPNSILLDDAHVKEHIANLKKDYTSKGSASKYDGFQKASLEDVVRPLQQAIQGEAKALADTQKLLDSQYAQGDISLKTYLDSEKDARQKALDATVADYDKEIAATERYIATVKDATRKLTGETLLKTEIAKKEQYIRDMTSKDSLGNQNDTKKIQDYTDGIAKLSIQLATLQHRFLDAATAQDELANRLNRKKLQANADSGMPGAQGALEDDKQIQKYALAKAAVAEQTDKYNLKLQNQATFEGRIALEQRKGNISELEGLIAIGRERTKEVEQLQQVADNMILVAKSVGDQKMIQDAEAFKLKVDEMAESADVLAIRINGLLDGPLQTFFASMMSHPKSIAQAFIAMGNTIASEIDKIVAKELSAKLLGAGTGSGGGFGGFISGLFGGGSGGGGGGYTGAAGVGGTGSVADFMAMDAAGFADGGDPPVGVPSLVGERGPELFVPKTAGTVIPNHQLADMGKGGDTTHLTQNVSFILSQPPTRETQAQIATATFTAGSRMARRNS